MSTVISVENLSKTYRLGQIGTGTFAHDLNLWWARMRGKPNPLLRIGETDPLLTAKSTKAAKEELNLGALSGLRGSKNREDGDTIWALKDISFTVEQGEVLGIIGRNGAGKSTLLKILSRVTAPTSGKIKVKGRVASLLEVGTGFHPELTGRENIYLNGAILGMSRREIDRKFDEIVDFAEVEQFIDTPVKRYSSGMYVRLAFAVAAHLDPEILVVDEVLAVGDAAFQKKCLGKMGDVAKEGRTVLFVSHNMAAVTSLCNKCILLDKGAIKLVGRSDDVVSTYMQLSQDHSSKSSEMLIKTGNHLLTVKNFMLLRHDGKSTLDILSNESISFLIEFEIKKRLINFAAEIKIVDDRTGQLLTTFSTYLNGHYFDIAASRLCLRCSVPSIPMSPGQYMINLYIYNSQEIIFEQESVLSIQVHSNKNTGVVQNFKRKYHGIILAPCQWAILE